MNNQQFSALKSVKKSVPIKEVEHIIRQKSRRVIQRQAETYAAGVAALCGINTKPISAQTGLSECQVAYRLKHTGAGEMRRAYRLGRGPIAEYMMKQAAPFIREQFIEMMRDKLGLQSEA